MNPWCCVILSRHVEFQSENRSSIFTVFVQMGYLLHGNKLVFISKILFTYFLYLESELWFRQNMAL